MTVAAAVAFGALLVAALVCRARPLAGVSAAVERVLGFFGVAPADPDVAAGDFFGIAGAAGFVALFVAQRGGAAVDGLVALDLALTAVGASLALCWLIAWASDRPDPWADADDGEPGARSLETEEHPRVDV